MSTLLDVILAAYKVGKTDAMHRILNRTLTSESEHLFLRRDCHACTLCEDELQDVVLNFSDKFTADFGLKLIIDYAVNLGDHYKSHVHIVSMGLVKNCTYCRDIDGLMTLLGALVVHKD